MLVVSALVALVVAIGGVFWWPRHVTAGAAVAFAVSGVVTAAYRGSSDDNTTATWLLIETVGQLCVLAQLTRRSTVLVPFGVVAVGVSPLRIGLWMSPSVPGEVAGVCAVWALLAGAAAAVGAYLRSLDRARERAVDTARREQRLHLARDLHDWLAHEMTGIVLAAQAGQLGETDETDAARTFRQIEEAGVRGLEAMDRALRLLRTAGDRPSALATAADLRALVNRFAASTKATVTCDIDLDEPRKEIMATVHRVVTEALTNVRRHARGATEVRVLATREEANVIVEVTDNGGAGWLHRRTGGTGLAGLTEWVAALDGTLAAGRVEPAGWRVRAVVPA